MTWEQKFIAANAIGEMSIKLRQAGSWYVSHYGVDRKEGSFLSSGCTDGATPEQAVEQHWDWLTSIKHYIVLNAYTDKRRAVRWNGFMWEDVREERIYD